MHENLKTLGVLVLELSQLWFKNIIYYLTFICMYVSACVYVTRV